MIAAMPPFDLGTLRGQLVAYDWVLEKRPDLPQETLDLMGRILRWEVGRSLDLVAAHAQLLPVTALVALVYLAEQGIALEVRTPRGILWSRNPTAAEREAIVARREARLQRQPSKPRVRRRPPAEPLSRSLEGLPLFMEMP